MNRQGGKQHVVVHGCHRAQHCATYGMEGGGGSLVTPTNPDFPRLYRHCRKRLSPQFMP